jgi:ribonuclease HII
MSTKKDIDWVSAVIIDDDEDDISNTNNSINKTNTDEVIIPSNDIEVSKISNSVIKQRKIRQKPSPLSKWFHENIDIVEIGIDEAGRGPMFGRVYAGAVILPKDDSFDHLLMKDSKKFHSKTKIEQVAEYIKANAVAWAVEYEDEQKIDEINILQATQSAMHKAIKKVITSVKDTKLDKLLLLVDGNYFKPFTILNVSKTKLETVKYQLVEGGDNKYTSIAAASILAKVERDKYIDELCQKNPELVEYYGIDSNKGYGSKKHMEGIKKYGITKWHRRTFGICKDYSV